MPAAIVLRDATAADVPVLTATIRTAFEEYRGVLNPPSGSHNESDQAIAAILQKGGGLVASIDGALAGVVVFYPDENGSLYLGRLAVLPEFRRFGVARTLVQGVEAHGKQAGYARMTLAVRIQLTVNRQFFESLGYQFSRYGTHPGFTEPTFMYLEKAL